MYKPVPLVPPQLDEDDSECESMLNSVSQDEESRNGEQPQHSTGKPTELSTSRKIAFIVSVLNCILFIIVFLWVLPCDHNSCQGFGLSKEKEWEIDFDEQGTWLLQVAPATSNKAREVVVVANSRLFSNTQDVSSLCMIGNSTDITGVRAIDGKVLWTLNSTDHVHYINCSIVDLNNNGISDCLLYDQSHGFRAIDTVRGSFLWKTNLTSIGYESPPNVIIKDVQTAMLDVDKVSDLLLLVTDTESVTLAGVSGKSGDLLWHNRLNSNCSLIKNNKQLTISEVIQSVSCLNSTDLIGINTKHLMRTEHRNEPPKLEISSCQKCAPFVSGVPSGRYILHQGLKDYLVVARVNCTALQTQLKKIHI